MSRAIAIVAALLVCTSLSASGPASAAEPIAPCEPSPEVRAILQAATADRQGAEVAEEASAACQARLRAGLEAHPDDFFLLLELHLARRTTEDFEVVQSSLAALAAAHAGDARYALLSAYLLSSDPDPSPARAPLEALLRSHPEDAWVSLTAARAWSRGPGADPARVQSHVLAFRRACPDSLESYHLTALFPDRKLAARLMVELRERLAKRDDREAQLAYPDLWQLELKLVPAERHAALRAQVARDAARLRALLPEPDAEQIAAVEQAARLAGDRETGTWVEQAWNRRYPRAQHLCLKAFMAWKGLHPTPSSAAPDAESAARLRALEAESRAWVARWPRCYPAWLARLQALHELPDTPPAEIEQAAERLLATPEYGMGGGTGLVAEAYLERGLHLARANELVEKALAEDLESSRSFLRMKSDPETRSSVLAGDEYTFLRMAGLVTRAAARARDAALARAWHERIRQRRAAPLPDGFSEKDQGWVMALRDASWTRAQADLALAEGRKLDALGFLAQAAARAQGKEDPADPGDPRVRLRGLWAELGGGPEALAALLARLPEEDRAGRSEAEDDSTLWIEANRPLPAFDLPALRGKPGRSRDLRGKVALIAFSATWCAPCKVELRWVEKLRKRFARRKDVVFLVIDTDQDVGLVAPAMKAAGITLPVLLGWPLAEREDLHTMPTTWLVDRKGVIRFTHEGFGDEDYGQRWMDSTAQKIEALLAAEGK